MIDSSRPSETAFAASANELPSQTTSGSHSGIPELAVAGGLFVGGLLPGDASQLPMPKVDSDNLTCAESIDDLDPPCDAGPTDKALAGAAKTAEAALTSPQPMTTNETLKHGEETGGEVVTVEKVETAEEVETVEAVESVEAAAGAAKPSPSAASEAARAAADRVASMLRKAAVRRAAEARREELLAQAEAEGLTLQRSERSSTGFKCVFYDRNNFHKPYFARPQRDGKYKILGHFSMPEQAALAIARMEREQSQTQEQTAATTIPVEPVPIAVLPSARAPQPRPPMTPAQQSAAQAAFAEAEAEGVTLVRSDYNISGFKGVYLDKINSMNPYVARTPLDGRQKTLGHFAAPEQAALSIARWQRERREAAAAAPMMVGLTGETAAPPPLTPPLLTPAQHATAQAALAQADAEGLTLTRSDRSCAGFKNVYYIPQNGPQHPYLAKERRDGKDVRLGQFATPEQAALCIARWHKQQTASAETGAKEASAAVPVPLPVGLAPPMPARRAAAEAALAEAEAEGLALMRSDRSYTGFKNVYQNHNSSVRPFIAKENRDGKVILLGSFTTAEEAALCVARRRNTLLLLQPTRMKHVMMDEEPDADGALVTAGGEFAAGEYSNQLGDEDCFTVQAYEADEDDDGDALHVEVCEVGDDGGGDCGGDDDALHVEAWVEESNDEDREEADTAEVSSEEAAAEGVYTVQSLVASRLRCGRRQFLVRWHGYGSDDDTWEDEANILDPDLVRLFDLFVAGQVNTADSNGEKKRSRPVESDVVAKAPRVLKDSGCA